MALEIGRAAPAFKLKSQHGQVVSLGDYHGSKNVVVLFYPFAFSGVCTGELVEIRDNLADVSNDSCEVLAISCDPMYALRVFADRDGLAFPLLSDFWPHGAVAQAYGIFNEQIGAAGRATFIVDRSGVLRWRVLNQLGEARDLREYVKVLSDIS